MAKYICASVAAAVMVVVGSPAGAFIALSATYLVIVGCYEFDVGVAANMADGVVVLGGRAMWRGIFPLLIGLTLPPSTGNPFPLTKFQVIETEHDALCESYLHRRLSTKRITSGSAQEFFAITPAELISILDEVREYLDEWLPVVLEADKIAAEDDGSVKTPGNEAESIYQCE